MGTPIDHALGGSLYTVGVLGRTSLVTLLLQTTTEMRSNVGDDLSLSLSSSSRRRDTDDYAWQFVF
jgi:hypothetical protein